MLNSSRPLLYSSSLVLPTPTERFPASRAFYQPPTPPQASAFLAHSQTSKPTMKTQPLPCTDYTEEEPRKTQPLLCSEHTEEEPRKPQPLPCTDYTEEEPRKPQPLLCSEDTEEEPRQTQPASCAARPQSLVSAELSPALKKPTMQTQHLHFSERRTAADQASCGTSTQLLKTDSDSSGNTLKESTESSESDPLALAVEAIMSMSLESCWDVSSLGGEAADKADPSSLQVEEGTSVTAGEDEIFASEITLSDGECLPEIFACPEWSTPSDDDSYTLIHSLSEYVSQAEPELKGLAQTDTLQSDIIKECHVSSCETMAGVRIRANHFEVLGAGRRRSSLHSVSEPQPVLLRAKGPNNLFLVSDDSNLPSMSFINQGQVQQAVFHKQEFFDEIQCKVFTSFCHLPSKTYLGISADTQDVTFVRAASSESEEDENEAFVVSLNDPTRPAIAPEMPEDVSQGPDFCCLFVVVSDGYDSLQPALCQDKSLGVDDHNSLQVVDGCQWNFKLLTADQVRKFIPNVDLKKLMKKCQLAVLLISRAPIRH